MAEGTNGGDSSVNLPSVAVSVDTPRVAAWSGRKPALLPQNLIVFDKALCGGPQSRAAQRMFCHFTQGMRGRIACILAAARTRSSVLQNSCSARRFRRGFGL